MRQPEEMVDVVTSLGIRASAALVAGNEHPLPASERLALVVHGVERDPQFRGPDDDHPSRRALATYEECRASGKKLQTFLGDAFNRVRAAEH